MKSLALVLVAAIGLLLHSGCAIHSGYMNSSAGLNQANFSYTQTSLSGAASTTKIFGFGGLDRQALVDEAKREMLRENPLQSNQVLANVTVNWKLSFFLIIVVNKCTVTADIVEFN